MCVCFSPQSLPDIPSTGAQWTNGLVHDIPRDQPGSPQITNQEMGINPKKWPAQKSINCLHFFLFFFFLVLEDQLKSGPELTRIEHLSDLHYPDADPPCHFCSKQSSLAIHDSNRLKIVSGGRRCHCTVTRFLLLNSNQSLIIKCPTANERIQFK